MLIYTRSFIPKHNFFSYFGHHQIRRKEAAPVFRATNDSFIWNHVANLGLYEIWNSNWLKFKMLVGALELPLFTKIIRESSYEVLHSKQPLKTFWKRHLLLELTTTSCYEMYCEIGVRLFQMSYSKIVKQNSCYYI